MSTTLMAQIESNRTTALEIIDEFELLIKELDPVLRAATNETGSDPRPDDPVQDDDEQCLAVGCEIWLSQRLQMISSAIQDARKRLQVL